MHSYVTGEGDPLARRHFVRIGCHSKVAFETGCGEVGPGGTFLYKKKLQLSHQLAVL
jgi:hypothetical protein